MNTMKKALVMSIAAITLISGSAVFADDSNTDTIPATSLQEARKIRTLDNKEFKERRMQSHSDMKATRGEMKNERMQWKDENKDTVKQAFSDLSEEEKTELKALKDTFKTSMKDIRSNYKKDMTLEEKDALKLEAQDLHEKHYKSLKDILADNAEALALIEERKQLVENRYEQSKENRETRKQFRGEKSKMIVKYKQKFYAKLSSALPKLSIEKLEKVESRIEKALEKTENNTKIDQDKKDKILSQLISLQELIAEEIDQKANEDDTDLDAVIDEALN